MWPAHGNFAKGELSTNISTLKYNIAEYRTAKETATADPKDIS